MKTKAKAKLGGALKVSTARSAQRHGGTISTSASAAQRKAAQQRQPKQRAKAAFLAQLVRPAARPNAPAGREERIALAPDWLFGRGCLTHVRYPARLMRAANFGGEIL